MIIKMGMTKMIMININSMKQLFVCNTRYIFFLWSIFSTTEITSAHEGLQSGRLADDVMEMGRSETRLGCSEKTLS